MARREDPPQIVDRTAGRPDAHEYSYNVLCVPDHIREAAVEYAAKSARKEPDWEERILSRSLAFFSRRLPPRGPEIKAREQEMQSLADIVTGIRRLAAEEDNFLAMQVVRRFVSPHPPIGRGGRSPESAMARMDHEAEEEALTELAAQVAQDKTSGKLPAAARTLIEAGDTLAQQPPGTEAEWKSCRNALEALAGLLADFEQAALLSSPPLKNGRRKRVGSHLGPRAKSGNGRG